MAQFAYPDGDIDSSWGASTLIDEGATPDDGDFVDSGDNPGTDTAEYTLGNVTDPVSSSGHILRYRYTQTDGGVPETTGGTSIDLTVELRQGVTTIASNTHTGVSGAWAAGSFTLTSGEADSITDYTDLRIHLAASGGGGPPGDRRGVAVSWAEFECPDAPIGVGIVYKPQPMRTLNTM